MKTDRLKKLLVEAAKKNNGSQAKSILVEALKEKELKQFENAIEPIIKRNIPEPKEPTDTRLLALIKPEVARVIGDNMPTDEHFLRLIRPLIPQVKDGKSPKIEDVVRQVIAKLDLKEIDRMELVNAFDEKFNKLAQNLEEDKKEKKQLESKFRSIDEQIKDIERRQEIVNSKGSSGKYAREIPVDTTNFAGNLSSADDTVQKALETLDDAVTGSSAFTGLTDTPSSYTGQAGKFAKVKATEDGLEFGSGDGVGDMLAANNLSDLADAATARTNLGLGTIATKNYAALDVAVNEAKGTDIASATTTDIGAATGNYVNVTGTTTITGLGTVQAGTRRIVNFTGALTLTHNATSLILPTAANITTAAGDTAVFVSLGSGNWKCVSYDRASGEALASSGGGGSDTTAIHDNTAGEISLITPKASFTGGEVFILEDSDDSYNKKSTTYGDIKNSFDTEYAPIIHTHTASDVSDFDTAVANNSAVAANTAAVAALDQATILKGTWDASAGTFPGAGAAQAGWTYIVSVGGTVDGVAFTANDRILAILDNASTSTYASNWHKLDYTDQVLSVAGKTGAVTLASTDITDFNSAALSAAPAETTTTTGALISGATGKTTPVDADTLGISDSAASNVLKSLTWANVKATLKTYFDTLYQATGSYLLNVVEDTTPQLGGNLDTQGHIILGGTSTTADLTFQTTSGVGATGADMHFKVGNNGATEALTILNNGNVGIGTTTPQAKLDVQGGNIGLGYGYGLQATDAAYKNLITTGWNGTSDYTSLWVAGTNSGNSTAKVTILTSGNVGIGTASPGQKLDVIGSGRSTGAWAVGDSTGNFSGSIVNESDVSKSVTFAADPGNAGANSFMRFNVDGSERARIDSSGNLGIGTTSPTNKLDVNGTLGVINGTGRYLTITNSGTEVVYDTNDKHWFSTDASKRASINDGGLSVGSTYYSVDAPANGAIIQGNVGIGTTGPWEALSLPYNSKLSLGASTLYNFNIYKSSVGNLDTYFDSRDDVAANKMYFRMRTGGTPVNVLTMQADGNVGIGTTAPDYKLDINGALGLRATTTPADPDSGAGVVYMDSTTGDLMTKLNFGGTTKTVIIVDWSAV